MKRILYLSVIIIGITVLIKCTFNFYHGTICSDEIHKYEKNDGISDEGASEAGSEDEINLFEKKNVDYESASERKKNEDEIEWVNAVVKKNQDMVVDFLKDYPEEMKWVDISLFDFTKDGKREIVLSREYLAGLAGSTGVISYNYVYDQEGNKLFEFLSAWIASMELYTESESDSFYICSKMQWGSHNDMVLHNKIAKNEEWKEELRIVEWDMRSEIEVESAIEENYYILDILTEEEQELWEDFYEKLIKIRDEENRDINVDQFNKFLQNYENLEKSELDIYGSIYYSDNKIITEIEGEQFVIEE